MLIQPNREDLIFAFSYLIKRREKNARIFYPSFYESGITLIPKLEKDTVKKYE